MAAYHPGWCTAAGCGDHVGGCGGNGPPRVHQEEEQVGHLKLVRWVWWCQEEPCMLYSPIATQSFRGWEEAPACMRAWACMCTAAPNKLSGCRQTNWTKKQTTTTKKTTKKQTNKQAIYIPLFTPLHVMMLTEWSKLIWTALLVLFSNQYIYFLNSYSMLQDPATYLFFCFCFFNVLCLEWFQQNMKKLWVQDCRNLHHTSTRRTCMR